MSQATHGHVARKRFGQNFLNNPQVIDDIVNAVNPQADSVVVEIGPGLGALTEPLLQRVTHLHVVELDRDLIARLRKRWPAERLTVHEGDALRFDFGTIAPRYKIVGNLPYNISTPLLFHLATFADQVEDMHFMLQKEVVERMVAEPGCADYGRLGLMLQYYFSMEKLLDVPPGCFSPPPKVDSAVVRLIPYQTLPYPAQDVAVLSQLLTEAFSQRRKTIRNTLRGWFDETTLVNQGIDPSWRPENLTLAQYVALANFAVNHGHKPNK